MNDIMKFQRAEWYQNMVTDCKAIVTERLYRSRQEVIEGWHEVGRRILTDPHYKKFSHGNGDIKKQLAADIGASVKTLYYAIQFFEKFPTLESLPELPEGKNISWRKIIQKYLPSPSGNDNPELAMCTCKDCGNVHRKFMP